MKKIITVTLCIVLVLLFAGCGKNGDTSKVEIDYGASSIYSKEEIDSAIEIIKKQFALFEGCELHRLSYMTDEECNNADNIEWMNDLRTDDNKEAFTQCIAFESSLAELDEITYRAMMGEYIIYYRGKIVGGIYDDRLLVKPIKSAISYMPTATYELPYDGAREMLLVEDVDNKKFLTGLFNAMYDELPAPKIKKKK